MRRSTFIAVIAATAAVTASASLAAPASAPLRNIKIISSAGARGLIEGCSAWAEKNRTTVAMAVLDWGGNIIESHAMEGAAPRGIGGPTRNTFFAVSSMYNGKNMRLSAGFRSKWHSTRLSCFSE